MAIFDLVGNYDRAKAGSMQDELAGATFNQGITQKQGEDYTKAITNANSTLEIDALGYYNRIQEGGRIENMQDKPAGFKTTEQFKEWYEGTGPDNPGFVNKKSQLGKTNLNDYVALYGTKGTFRKLNQMGFGSALLGPGKQFDPETTTVQKNEETGEIEIVPYVRTDSKARNQSYSAPMTIGGKDIRDIITEFGPDAAEQSIVKMDIGSLNTIFQEYANDVSIGGGGNPAMAGLNKMRNIPWGSSDRQAIEKAIETRLDDSSAQTGGTPTTVDPTAVDSAANVTPTAVGSTANVTPTAVDSTTVDPTTVDPTAGTAKTFPVVDSSKYSGVLATMYSAQRQELGPDFYMGPGDTEALHTQLQNTPGVSKNVRDKTIENYKTIADKNLKAKVKDQILNYFGGKTTTRLTTRNGEVLVTAAGRLAEARSDKENPILDKDYDILKKNADWYKTNEVDIVKRLKNNPELYNEFVQDPDAFVARYVDDKEFFAPKVKPDERVVILSAAARNNVTVKDGSAIDTAIKAGDFNQAGVLLEKAAAKIKFDKNEEQKIADLITAKKGRFDALDQSRRAILASEILASLPADQRKDFMSVAINLIETGDMTMTTPQLMAAQSSQSSSNTAKLTLLRGLSKDADDLLKPDTVSNAVTKIRNDIIGVDSEDPLPITSANILDFAGQVSHLINGSKRRKKNSPQEHEAALGLGLTVIDKYYELKAKPKWWQELITLGYAIGPQSGGFNLSPNVRGYDVDGKITLVPTEIDSFGEPGMNPISLKQIERDLGNIGMNVFYDAFVVAIAENE
jgi:hypothetical protein